MTDDYLSMRLNVVQVAPEELNAKLAALAEAFDEAWLASEGDHPLQILWRRNDVLATNELLNFGDAVERLGQEDAGWLADQVNKIRTGDAGQCAGAVFEIFALNFFAREACQVIPAPDSMPGFDGTVLMKDGARILVSVKNHGLSAREQAFLADARAFDEGFKTELVSRRLRDVDLNVLAAKHLAEPDFAQLRTDLAHCLDELPAGAGYRPLERPYTIIMRQMTAEAGELSPFGQSSSCRVMSPMAKNEQLNFLEAIRKGCENLYTHTKAETGDVCRMIILRLSNAASVARCVEWANWYFQEHAEAPVDVILLYQTAVVTDVIADTSRISHNVTAILGPRFATWRTKTDGSQRQLPDMRFLVGTVSTGQSRMLLMAGDTEAADLSDHYVYQRTDVFQRMIVTAAGVEGTLSNPAPGVLVHAVFEENGAPQYTISTRADREQTLLLLP